MRMSPPTRSPGKAAQRPHTCSAHVPVCCYLQPSCTESSAAEQTSHACFHELYASHLQACQDTGASIWTISPCLSHQTQSSWIETLAQMKPEATTFLRVGTLGSEVAKYSFLYSTQHILVGLSGKTILIRTLTAGLTLSIPVMEICPVIS